MQASTSRLATAASATTRASRKVFHPRKEFRNNCVDLEQDHIIKFYGQLQRSLARFARAEGWPQHSLERWILITWEEIKEWVVYLGAGRGDNLRQIHTDIEEVHAVLEDVDMNF